MKMMDPEVQDERVAKLMTKLKAQDKKGLFKMNTWKEKEDCGTAACIGGTIQMLQKKKYDEARSYAEQAGAWIGLSEPLAQELFYPPRNFSWDKITLADAEAAIYKAVDLSRRTNMIFMQKVAEMQLFWRNRMDS
jgi:hypothetical protein